MTEPMRETSSDFRIRLWLALVLAAVTIAVFWPATHYDFLNFDDDRYVSANSAVLQGLTIPSLRWAFTAVYEDWWLPMLWISYMVDHTLWGAEPFGYHLTNILLHAANAALLFWVLSRMTGSRWRSAFVAALFALHPLRVESVAWIAARKDVLSGFFFLLGLWAYLPYVENPKSAWRWSLPLLMLLGLMSKAIVVIFPFVLLLLDFWPLRRAHLLWGREAWSQWRPLLREKIPLFALALVFILLNLHTHRTGNTDYTVLPPLDRLGLVFPNYGDYLRLIFWPVRLILLQPVHDVVNWPVSLAAATGLLALTLGALLQREKRPYLLVGWLWFLLALFPVIRGIRFGLAAYANRFTYLPSIGLAIALVWAVSELIPRWLYRRPLLAALALAILSACVFQTRATLPLWKDSLAAFGNVLKFAPDHALSHNNYGEALLKAGQTRQALSHFEEAVAGLPQTTSFISNLGLALVLLGRSDEAILRMESARLRLNPDCEFLNFNLAVAWMEKHDPQKAIPYFQRALAHSDVRPTWRAELARAYRESGQMEAFSNEMRQVAADGFPQLASYDGLCLYYLELWKNGHGRRSWTFFQRALSEYPDNVPMLNDVAWFLATDPPVGAERCEALRLAQRAHELSGDGLPALLDTLAAAYAADGQFDEAVRWAEKASNLAQAKGPNDLAREIALRLQAYHAGKAWGRNGPVDP